MNRLKGIIFYLILIASFALHGNAQEVVPTDGITLNHTQILFEVPAIEGANNYRFKVYECNNRTEACKEIFQTTEKHRAVILSQPFRFGATYRWTYEGLKGKKVLYLSPERVLYIPHNPLVDTNVQKLVFRVPNKSRNNGLLFIDGQKLAVDMQGRPVFYLNYKFDHAIRDINLTPQGTITIIDNRYGEIKEMRLNGEMVWAGPGKFEETDDRSDKFHHEFEKLKNGHYLAAGKKKVSEFDESAGLQNVPGNTLCETLVEFDGEMNEVWRFDLLPELWRQYHIVPGIDLFNPTRLGHLNGMAVDEKNNWIYASFKTFNTVMKIERSSNNILYQYGAKRINFLDSLEDGLPFEQQHAPAFNHKGNLIVFNNGNEKTGSGISELSTGINLDSTHELIRNFYFKEVLSKDFYAVQMGSVQDLGKNRYLVCMGSLPHLFEVDLKKKKILWQIYTYQNPSWESGEKRWKPQISYRSYWYSSLYPHHFVADQIKKSRNLKLKIYNCGSEDDAFQLFVKPVLGPEMQVGKTLYLKPGKQGFILNKATEPYEAVYLRSILGKQIQTIVIK